MNGLKALVAVLSVGIAACGGGGGGGDGTSLDVSPGALQFSMDDGGALPASKTVTASFKGDGVLVGYAPEIPEPDWLYVNALSNGDQSPQQFAFQPVQPGPPGTYATSVRFLTGRADGSGIKIKDVPVTVVVHAVFRATPATLTRSFVRGGANFAQDTLEVTKNDDNWNVSVDQPWISTSVSPGDAPAIPGHVTLYYDVDALAPGQHVAVVTVYDTLGVEASQTVEVTLNVRGPNLLADSTSLQFSGISAGAAPAAQAVELASETSEAVAHSAQVTYGAGASGWLSTIAAGTTPRTLTLAPTTAQLSPGTYTASIVLTPANGQPAVTIAVSYTLTAATLSSTGSLEFSIDEDTLPGAALVDSREFSDNGGPLNWQVTAVSQPWLNVTQGSGDTRTNRTLTVELVPEELDALSSGAHTAALTVVYGNAVTADREQTIPVSLNLGLPRVTSVAPYYAGLNRALSHVIRGSGFATLTQPIYVGDTELTDYEVVSDSEIRATLPADQAGDHVVRVANNLSLQRSAGTLRVVDTPAFGEFTVARSGASQRLIYDPVRFAAYSLDDSSRITRYAWTGSTWEQDTLLELDAIASIEMGLDGDTLYLASHATVYTLDLADPAATPVALFSAYDAGSNSVGNLHVLNDGRILLTTSQDYGLRVYDAATNTVPFRSGDLLICPTSVTSAMRESAFYGGEGCAGTQAGRRYEVHGDAFAQTQFTFVTLAGKTALNRDGERLVLNSTLYDTTDSYLTVASLGNIDLYGPTFSGDGTRLYGIYPNYETNQVFVTVYDLSLAPVGGSYVPTTYEITGVPEHHPIRMQAALTPDDATLIFAGITEFRVYPVPE